MGKNLKSILLCLSICVVTGCSSTPSTISKVDINKDKPQENATFSIKSISSPNITVNNKPDLNFHDPLRNQSFRYGSYDFGEGGHTANDKIAAEGTPMRAPAYGKESYNFNQLNPPDRINHGMGNTTIIQYLLNSGKLFYYLGAHAKFNQLQSSTPDGAKYIPLGAKIQEVGHTGGPWFTSTNRVDHSHQEGKTAPVLYNPCGSGTHYGYVPGNPTNYCYFNLKDYFGNPDKKIMVPSFSWSSSEASSNVERVFGYDGEELYSKLEIKNGNSDLLLVGGRKNFLSQIEDFPALAKTDMSNETHISNRKFTAGTYTFRATVADMENGQYKYESGYGILFEVLPDKDSFIIDNRSNNFNSYGLGEAAYYGYYYDAFAATAGKPTNTSTAWAQWKIPDNKSGRYKPSVFIGGNGSGLARFKIYTKSGLLMSDPIDFSKNRFSWVDLTVNGQNVFEFAEGGYIGLSNDQGNASDVYLFDAIKFLAAPETTSTPVIYHKTPGGTASLINRFGSSFNLYGIDKDVLEMAGSNMLGYQWQVGTGKEQLQIYPTKDLENVVITLGTWSDRRFDRHIKLSKLSTNGIVISPKQFGFSGNEGLFYIITIQTEKNLSSNTYVYAKPVSAYTTNFNVISSEYQFKIDGIYKYAGSGSIINYNCKIGRDFGCDYDIFKIRPDYNTDKITGFFQYQVDTSKGTKIRITSDNPNLTQATLRFGYWDSRSSDKTLQVKLPYTLDLSSNGFNVRDNSWFMLRLNFDNKVNDITTIKAEVVK